MFLSNRVHELSLAQPKRRPQFIFGSRASLTKLVLRCSGGDCAGAMACTELPCSGGGSGAEGVDTNLGAATAAAAAAGWTPKTSRTTVLATPAAAGAPP